jgi:nucleoside-diphosphate-sugar epimerase
MAGISLYPSLVCVCRAEATAGVQYVVHTASPFFLGGGNEAAFLKPAVEGTLHVLRACSRKGSQVKRVVVTSSTVAVTEGRYAELPETHVYTEADWTNPNAAGDAYSKSKTLAEKVCYRPPLLRDPAAAACRGRAAMGDLVD